MIAIASGLELDVERGPDWLIVRIQSKEVGQEDVPPLAEQVWSLLERHFTHRLVLDLDRISVLNSYLIGQLIQLYRKIGEHDGVMRLCGLSAYNRRVLHTCRLDDRFRSYEDRQEAVMGFTRPSQPR
jgi:anti-anti-sigma factor